MTDQNSAAIVDQLDRLYTASVDRLRAALRRYVETGERPDSAARAAGAFAYPELRLHYSGNGPADHPDRSYARLTREGLYAISITQPSLFREYLTEQLDFLLADFDVRLEVGHSRQEIPYPYVLDAEHGIDLSGAASVDIGRVFPSTMLSQIGDEVVDGLWDAPDEPRPLALFDAQRADFSLARLRHYTGTPSGHIQKYILFTNYHRYVDEFVRWACSQLSADGPYRLLSCSGGLELGPGADPDEAITDSAWRRHQMPAYHLVAPDRSGITLVNIGVGPSNAKTITDHLAVMRPEVWLMIGHCGGLRPSQRIGDYVLAHAYLRDDHVLDDVLPPEIPIPAIAEVQLALVAGAEAVSGETQERLKRRLRTGTVVTTDDRNWELRYTRSALRFSQSRAVAIDMESATLAAQGYRFRVPYGTLLCVSDRPIHGEIKLPGQANRFYERAISEHLRIGIAAIDELRRTGHRLHSRKLRAFDEPPFR
ncbi:AMP nucleosidase [Flavisphingomonas formosensis]|uniref:AMP nucleosidase n=1 Tax=Flavisphingomonas formosensis TaxID=861534 RepID=UPI0012F95F28|nr:AMP nucleosidase [Sphingomonas formosensis]